MHLSRSIFASSNFTSHPNQLPSVISPFSESSEAFSLLFQNVFHFRPVSLDSFAGHRLRSCLFRSGGRHYSSPQQSRQSKVDSARWAKPPVQLQRTFVRHRRHALYASPDFRNSSGERKLFIRSRLQRKRKPNSTQALLCGLSFVGRKQQAVQVLPGWRSTQHLSRSVLPGCDIIAKEAAKGQRCVCVEAERGADR